MKESKESIVRYALDPNKPHKLSNASKVRMDGIKDEQIDYSEIPELTDDWFARAQHSREMKIPTKHQISLRVDDDVLAFFKAHGTRYQTRINAVLRAYVEAHKGT
jgi:uncharacterized protein (DUF4415 family)